MILFQAFHMIRMATIDAKLSAQKCSDSFKPFLDKLPKIDVTNSTTYYNFQGFWYPPRQLEAVKSIQSNFVSRDDDIIITSSMKTGTHWLKALVYCIIRPKITDFSDDPLAENHPSVLVPTLEAQTFIADHNPDLSGLPSPRIFHTHVAYMSLPDSIKDSRCKIVYIVRNPKDTFVSMWNFFNTVWESSPIELSFERFCNGVVPFGPFFEHVLSYWNQSLKAPEKVLFLKYEDLKKDPKREVERVALFLGKPLEDKDEDEDEEIDRMIWRCSLERIKNLEVNKSGVVPIMGMPNKSFFRLGVVGDWKNTFTPEMKERLDQITKMKLEGSDLDLDV